MLGLECSSPWNRDMDVDSDRRLEAFKMWICGRMEKISWFDKY